MRRRGDLLTVPASFPCFSVLLHPALLCSGMLAASYVLAFAYKHSQFLSNAISFATYSVAECTVVTCGSGRQLTCNSVFSVAIGGQRVILVIEHLASMASGSKIHNGLLCIASMMQIILHVQGTTRRSFCLARYNRWMQDTQWPAACKINVK